MYTTLNKLKIANLECEKGWGILLKRLNKTKPDDSPISYSQIYSALGLMPAIKCLKALEDADIEKAKFYRFLSSGNTEEDIAKKFLELFGD